MVHLPDRQADFGSFIGFQQHSKATRVIDADDFLTVHRDNRRPVVAGAIADLQYSSQTAAFAAELPTIVIINRRLAQGGIANIGHCTHRGAICGCESGADRQFDFGGCFRKQIFTIGITRCRSFAVAEERFGLCSIQVEKAGGQGDERFDAHDGSSLSSLKVKTIRSVPEYQLVGLDEVRTSGAVGGSRWMLSARGAAATSRSVCSRDRAWQAAQRARLSQHGRGLSKGAQSARCAADRLPLCGQSVSSSSHEQHANRARGRESAL